MAATAPMLIAYDAAVGSTPTTVQASDDAARSEGEAPRINAYDRNARPLFAYDAVSNPHMIASAEACRADDGALGLRTGRRRNHHRVPVLARRRWTYGISKSGWQRS